MADGRYSETLIGTVMKIDKEKRRVGVYIPKLMSAMYGDEVKEYTMPTNYGLSLGSFDMNVLKSIKKINYIWARNWYYDAPMPVIGSRVAIYFIDNNVNLAFWKKFNPNNDYDEIEEEKYKNVNTLSIGDSTLDIKESDSINIKLPDYFKYTKIEDNKEKQIIFQENFNFYKNLGLVDAISDLQKSMAYLENEYNKKFVSEIENIKSVSNDDYLSGIFESYKQDGLVKVQNKNNLLDSGYEYDYFKLLLGSLNSAYTNYLSCSELLDTNITDEDLKQTFKANLDNNIQTAYTSVATTTEYDIEKLQNYVIVLESVFNPKPIVYFTYFDSAQSSEVTKEIEIDLYTKIDSIVTENEISPSYTPTSDIYTTSSSTIVVGWRSKNKTEEYITESKKLELFPLFVGLGLTENKEVTLIDEKEIISDTDEIYSVSVNGGAQSAKMSLADLNETIKGTASITSLNIKMIKGEISLSLEYTQPEA